MRTSRAWAAVVLVTAVLTAITTAQALRRYDEFRTGWSWDLAYYNQWFWSMARGDRVISVQPMAVYATEGPSAWKMNYLAPVRFLILPFYAIWPDPRTLLVVQNVVFWWIIPAAFFLARRESGSDGVALSAAALVPLTPILWPLAWNDFRELQLAAPFFLLAVDGYRARDARIAGAGVAGLLACRQEFAVAVATFALIPSRRPESIGRTVLWAHVSVLLGACWMCFGFLFYLKFVVAGMAPLQYLEQFSGPKPVASQFLHTAVDFLLTGFGSWAFLALLAPRMALLAAPGVYSFAGGLWALSYLGHGTWHHVRYAALVTPAILAAGLIGYCRLAGFWESRGWSRRPLAACWLVAAAGLLLGCREVLARMATIPVPITRDDAEATWRQIARVGPDDAVLAGYEVTAPLSSRRRLYSYVLAPNRPRGYPKLDPGFRWVFVIKADAHHWDTPKPADLLAQGFVEVHSGPSLAIYRRDAAAARPGATDLEGTRR